MANYKIELTLVELEKLNQIKRSQTRKTAMSVYTKMKKYTNISTGIVFRTITDILKLINRSLELSKTHLYRILKILKELELITSEKSNYYLTVFGTKKEESSIEVVENEFEDTTPAVEEKVQATGEKHEETVIKDYINQEVVAPVELVAVANKTINTLYHANSNDNKFVKKLVTQKLRECVNVNRLGMTSYIATVIEEKVKQMKNMKVRINNEVVHKDRFNGFNQRTYDFEDLERKLLGWT